MKRRFAAVILSGFLLVGLSAPAFATTSRAVPHEQVVRDYVAKFVSHLKKVFQIVSQDDPTPPKPCTTNCP